MARPKSLNTVAKEAAKLARETYKLGFVAGYKAAVTEMARQFTTTLKPPKRKGVRNADS